MTKLGSWDVRCRRVGPPSGVVRKYGRIGRVDLECTEDEILEKTRSRGLCSSNLVGVMRIPLKFPKKDGTKGMSEYIRLEYDGPLPEKILFGHQSYVVHQHIFPISRCHNCYQFGHSKVSCCNKVRCSQCSGFHLRKTPEGTLCPREARCYMCGGSHRLV